jgi:cytochrome oxidase Cu insertion factor (SCO1/SenC/PrrC family)
MKLLYFFMILTFSISTFAQLDADGIEAQEAEHKLYVDEFHDKEGKAIAGSQLSGHSRANCFNYPRCSRCCGPKDKPSGGDSTLGR